MVFNLREAVSGFKHLRLNWTRMLSNRPDTWFIKNYEIRGLNVERFTEDGRPAICSICGYAMIRLELKNGWLMDTCSAMPVLSGLESKEFAGWVDSLDPVKLPTSRV